VFVDCLEEFRSACQAAATIHEQQQRQESAENVHDQTPDEEAGAFCFVGSTLGPSDVETAERDFDLAALTTPDAFYKPVPGKTADP
jgi:hypothetical protein